MLLGAAIGNRVCVDAVLMQMLDEFKRLQQRLKLLNVDDAFYLIRNCFSLPKLLYTLRSAPCFASTELVHYDTLIGQTLQEILNIQFEAETWHQSTLPDASITRWTWSEISDRYGAADVPCICHGVSRFYITAVAFSSTSRYRSSSHQCAECHESITCAMSLSTFQQCTEIMGLATIKVEI